MSARRYVEGLNDDAYERASTMWEHPRRLLAEDLSNAQQLFHVRDTGLYAVPNTKMLRGLRKLGIITGTTFLPDKFRTFISERSTMFPGSIDSDENYAWLTYKRMHAPIHGQRSAYVLNGPNGLVLEIPLNDVYDFPGMLFMYILNVLSLLREGGVYHTQYCIDPTDDIREQMRVLETFTKNRGNGGIPLRPIISIYNSIISAMYDILHGFLHISNRASWVGSDPSGTRIMIYFNDGRTVNVRIRLNVTQGIGVQVGGRWSDEVKRILDELFKDRCYLTVCNENDDLCLLYCIFLGVMTHRKELWMTRTDKVIPPETINCHAVYDSDSPRLQVLGKELIEGNNMMEQLGVKCGDEMSIMEFRKKMAAVEDYVLSDDLSIFALDVYILEQGLLKHVYPAYISPRVNPLGRIPIVCVQNKHGGGHYILATNLDMIIKCSGGKIFFNCSVCGAAFYSKTSLKRHVHFSDKEKNETMHWNRLDITDDAVPKGYCWKCMLKFPSEFETEYHKDHCFMTNKTGYRYVRCVESKNDDLPVLHGVKVDVEQELRKQGNIYIMFADFESYIDGVTGEHQIMSWGCYDTVTDVYYSGYDLGEFMKKIYTVACGNTKTIVYFHNAMNYDGNFILRYVLSHEWTKNWTIQPIMKSSSRMQKLSFQFTDEDKHRHVLDIGDTFLFLTMSLDRIVKSIRCDSVEENKHVFTRFFRQFKKKYPWVTESEIDLVLKKNLFPYKFFDDKSKLDTSIAEFREIFKGENDEFTKYFSENVTIDDLRKQYSQVSRIFGIFKCRDARDYHDIYLLCDVMELSDVFMRSIEVLWESHHIYLPEYIGMPAASWAAFLRHDPKMEIPLYSSTTYAELFASMTRGGVTSAPLRYAKSDATHSIIYLDVNGLYPYVMQAYKYPCDYFMWITFDSIPADMDCNTFLMSEVFPSLRRCGDGMAIVVDLIIPDTLKIVTDDFPFAPEHRVIYDEYFDNEGELRGFLQSWTNANNGEKMHAFTGLVGTLYDKKQYTVHWRLLEWYIKHGIIVSKVWWGVRFHEGDYLAGYVRKNIEIRNQRRDELGKMVYKLMGNSIYGKTFESPFKRGTYEIVKDKIKLAGMLEEDNVSTVTPIDELAWVIKMDGEEVVLDKPTYIGACVCEYAKMHMYELFYDKLRPIFPEVHLVYTDTDSVIVYITHDEELQDPKKLFDYIKEKHPDLIGSKGGQVKSEVKDAEGNDDIIQEVIALRSKVYAYKTRDGHIGKRAKGTTHAAQEMQLDWEVYENVLKNLVSKTTSNMQFIRTRFDVFTKDVQKQSLSANDGKREICDDGIHTHAWGFF